MIPDSSISRLERTADPAQASLYGAAALMIVGSLYGLLVAGSRGLLTPFEWASLPPVIAVGIVVIYVLRRHGAPMIRRLGLVTSLVLGLYVIGNVANAVFFSDDLFKLYLHSVWVLPLLLLVHAVNRRRIALVLSVALTLAVSAVIAAAIASGRAGGMPPSYLDSLVTMLLALLMTLVLLFRISSWLEGIAAEKLRARMLAARSVELDDLARRLMASEERSRTILEQSPDVICNIDAEGRFLMVSSRVRQLFGMEPEALAGTTFTDIVHPDDRAFAQARLDAVLAGMPTANLELRILRPDGATVPTVWSAVWSEQSNSVFAVARDLAERIAAEERAHRSERLIALGQLTGGLAHDFNNLLTVILGNAEMILERAGNDARLAAMAELIRTSARHGANLTNRLLAFSRRQNLVPETVYLSRLVDGLFDVLRNTMGDTVEISCLHQPDQWPVRVDPVQLEAAIINLCVNARDAMPDGGRLTIETGNAWSDGNSTWTKDGKAPDDYVALSLTDTGIGMPPEVLARAFEPFFTTKEVGKGTGLGLSMVYGFVRQSGGHVQMESESGHGTRVTLFLPRDPPLP
ncbi:MAG: PAS domain S-box protein [Alphaproteobacteria bacterium]|nr:PAS domain S-box protein [Alphaproteobacteria bacterium]